MSSPPTELKQTEGPIEHLTLNVVTPSSLKVNTKSDPFHTRSLVRPGNRD